MSAALGACVVAAGSQGTVLLQEAACQLQGVTTRRFAKPSQWRTCSMDEQHLYPWYLVEMQREEKVKLLPSDAEVSSAEDLKHEDGNSYFACCHQHRALYEGQAAKRTCVFEGCDREVKGTTRPGLRLCKLHGAKEERAKPTAKLRNPSLAVKPPVENPTSAKARFVPRDDGTLVVGPSSAAAGSQPSTQATSLRRYLREGKEEASALRACSLPGCGPRETWEDLKSQATAYVTRLPRDYPTKARKAIVYLVTEDCPISE